MCSQLGVLVLNKGVKYLDDKSNLSYVMNQFVV